MEERKEARREEDSDASGKCCLKRVRGNKRGTRTIRFAFWRAACKCLLIFINVYLEIISNLQKDCNNNSSTKNTCISFTRNNFYKYFTVFVFLYSVYGT